MRNREKIKSETSPCSVWLTAYAAQILDESLSEVPERFGFSVDLQVIESAVKWTITQQLAGGSFQEVEMFPEPSQAPVEFQEISVTSQVVIMLASLRNMKQEKEVLDASTGWLTRQLSLLDRDPHPHDLAITAYALHLAGTPSKDPAFQLLSKYRVESDHFMFWGSDTEPARPARVVGTMHHLLPNPTLCCQSLSVRATSYGLLTYTLRGEFIMEPIVQWLNARRHAHSAWTAAVDSALATQALVSNSLLSMQAETSMSVSLEFEGNKKKSVLLTVNSLEQEQDLEVELLNDTNKLLINACHR